MSKINEENVKIVLRRFGQLHRLIVFATCVYMLKIALYSKSKILHNSRNFPSL